MTFLTLLLDGIQWADKAVENLDFLDVFAIDLFRFGYQNLVNQLMQHLIGQFGDASVLADFINKILNLVQLMPSRSYCSIFSVSSACSLS